MLESHIHVEVIPVSLLDSLYSGYGPRSVSCFDGFRLEVFSTALKSIESSFLNSKL